LFLPFCGFIYKRMNQRYLYNFIISEELLSVLLLTKDVMKDACSRNGNSQYLVCVIVTRRILL
jgi:hypothetical protein